MDSSSYVRDADAASFQSLVLDESRRVLVLVDFWAEWCGPCRALAPVLEKLVDACHGRVLLVKVDTDREQSLAGQYAVRSLPTVKLFKNGEVVDEFMGVQPESRIRDLIEAHVTRESDQLRAEAAAMQSRGQLAQARALLEQAHASDPGNRRIAPDLVNVLIDLNALQNAQALIESATAEGHCEDDLQRCAERLGFAELSAGSPPPAELMAAIERDPRDCESRYLAGAWKAVDGDFEGALEQFIEILRRDRGFRDDAARRGILSIFRMLGSGHPLVSRYRARMASLLH